MNPHPYKFGRYLRDVWTAGRNAGGIKWALPLVWFVYPVLVVTSAHCQDAAGLFYYLGGHLVPRVFSATESQRAVLAVIGAWTGLLAVHLAVVITFYRRATFAVPLWPVALFVMGGIGNFVWWIYTGHWDAQGAIAGMAPGVAMAIVEKVLDGVGRGFVFGETA